MKPALLCWIGSFLTLHSVSSSAAKLSFMELPTEMQLAIMDQVGFCDYVESLKVGRGAPANMDVGMAMLAQVAKEEASLGLGTYRQRARKQQILKSVRTFVRLRSGLPIVCKITDKEKLEHLAQVLESTYRDVSSFSESPTWKKACMAGLFGRNTLITLLPHLSKDFCSDNKATLLRTAFVVGDIDSVNAIIGSFSLSKDKVLGKVSGIDIVFSGSVDFFDELLELLPNVMEKRLNLIEEASLLNRLAVLTRILDVAEPAERDELSQIITSFWRLQMFENQSSRWARTNQQVYTILLVAAQHGHLSIIQFLWPAMKLIGSLAECAVRDMMLEAGRSNHRNLIEFLMWHSGVDYMKMAQEYVNDAFKAAVGGGNFEIVTLLARKDSDGQFVAPKLCLTALSEWELRDAIKTNNNWNGMRYLVDLKNTGDSRFADFELVDHDNTALCLACEVGNYELVKYLLCTADDGEFVFSRTNPAAQNNKPLVSACSGEHLKIVQELLKRGPSGDYIYRGVDPSAQDYESVISACRNGHLGVVKVFLEVKDGKYVLPRMDIMDITRALTAAIDGDKITIVEFLFERKHGNYVLPGMKSVNLSQALRFASKRNRMEVVRFLVKMENETYVLPGMKDINLIPVLKSAILSHQKEVVELLLSRALDGSYLHPRVGVTGDMLTIPDISPEMRELLEEQLEQQRIDV